MAVRQIILELDEDDWNTIESEFALRQSHRVDGGDGGTQPILPEGDSNLEGAMVAEIVRDLDEYRLLFEKKHPRTNQ